MNYTALHFKVEPLQPGSDILIALLGELGFESFVNTPEGFDAFIPEGEIDLDVLKQFDSFEFNYSYVTEVIEQKNWNEEWENNFAPVYFDDKCCIRAPFHSAPEKVKQDILIQPKMSFGTGHHNTTWLMSEAIFDLDVMGKKVLDMGCGTGVLAILCEKQGATFIDAIDIDEWSVENAKENCALNNCSKTKVMKGNSALLEAKTYDVILANINKNVLLNDMPAYKKAMLPGAFILFSGFFDTDIAEIRKKAEEENLIFVSEKIKDNWALLKFIS